MSGFIVECTRALKKWPLENRPSSTEKLYQSRKADGGNRYVTYAMGKIRMLQYFGIKPYVVFDGGLLPNKMGTERDRAQSVVMSLPCPQLTQV